MRYFRAIVSALLGEVMAVSNYDVAVQLVTAAEITGLNETYLRHEGATDVITFDYAEDQGKQLPRPALHGEICICVKEALAQSRHFRTTWQSEIVRYVIHGILHLQGYGDVRPRDRRLMKREESRLLLGLARRFNLAKLALAR